MDDLNSILNTATLPLWVLVVIALATPIITLTKTVKEWLLKNRGLTAEQRKQQHTMGLERGEEKSKFIDTLLERLSVLERKNDELDEKYHALLEEVAYLRGRVSMFEQCGEPDCPVRSFVNTPPPDRARSVH